ncbi:unnamed protein product, partial [Phaeothamnion confervicola]
LVTYNVQGLGSRHGVMPPPSRAQDERLQAVADSIKELDGDVVSLQEVPSKSALENFVRSQGLAEQYPHRRFFQTNDESGANHLAVLSKHPILESKSNKDRPLRVDGSNRPGHITRDITEVKVKLGGWPVRIYNTHLKANSQLKRWDPSQARDQEFSQNIRLAEGRALKDIIKANYKKSPSEHFVVTMDANATPDDKIISHLTGGHAPAHDVIGNAPGFESHPSSNRRLDYILLSDGLASHYVQGSAQVLNTP